MVLSSSFFSMASPTVRECFGEKNLRRMIQSAEVFPPGKEIVVSLIRQLSWTHFIALLRRRTTCKGTFMRSMQLNLVCNLLGGFPRHARLLGITRPLGYSFLNLCQNLWARSLSHAVCLAPAAGPCRDFFHRACFARRPGHRKRPGRRQARRSTHFCRQEETRNSSHDRRDYVQEH